MAAAVEEAPSETLLSLPLEMVDLVLWKCTQRSRLNLRLVSREFGRSLAALMRWHIRTLEPLEQLLAHYGSAGVGYLNLRPTPADLRLPRARVRAESDPLQQAWWAVLQQLVHLRELRLSHPAVGLFLDFRPFVSLEFLDCSRTATTADQLCVLTSLRRLSIAGCRSLYPAASLSGRAAADSNSSDPLAALTNLRELNASGSVLRSVRAFSNLTALDCSQAAFVTDPDCLLHLTRLQSLVCMQLSAQLSAPLRLYTLTALTDLNCIETPIESADLRFTPHLRRLRGVCCPISHLLPLQALEELHCIPLAERDAGARAGLGGAAGAYVPFALPALRHLDCSYRPQLGGQRVFGLLRNLRSLYATDCDLTDADLEGLSNLRVLLAGNSHITRFDAVPLLERLDARPAVPRSHAADPFGPLVRLRHLDVRCSTCVHTGMLRTLTALTTLHCSNTAVDVGLLTLPCLQTLSCSNTIVTLSGLARLTTLRTLDCSNTAVTTAVFADMLLLRQLMASNCGQLRDTPADIVAGCRLRMGQSWPRLHAHFPQDFRSRYARADRTVSLTGCNDSHAGGGCRFAHRARAVVQALWRRGVPRDVVELVLRTEAVRVATSVR